MSSKTKIVVLHMKEIIYTAVFAVFAIILILLLLVMFLPRAKETSGKAVNYQAGVYTSDLTLGNTQSLENISYSEDNPYTSQVILNAIEEALKKAAAN